MQIMFTVLFLSLTLTSKSLLKASSKKNDEKTNQGRFYLNVAKNRTGILILPECSSDDRLNTSRLIANNNEWMKKIKNNVIISKLAIPGTHDSAAFSMNSPIPSLIKIIKDKTQTQVWDLEEQMEAGIRYFDLRVDKDGDIHHKFKTGISLELALKQLTNFLKKHKSEGFIVRIDYNGKKEDLKFKDNILKVLDEFKKEKFFITSKKIPKMGELRQKIFLITNFDYDNALLWDDGKSLNYFNPDVEGAFILQDFYKLYDIEEKKKIVQEYLNFSKTNTENYLIINHCSATTMSLSFSTIKYLTKSILEIAQEINYVPYSDDGYSGILAFDFPSEDLINRIILQNYDPEKNLAKGSWLSKISDFFSSIF